MSLFQTQKVLKEKSEQEMRFYSQDTPIFRHYWLRGGTLQASASAAHGWSSRAPLQHLFRAEAESLPSLLNNSRDPKQPKICDHHFIGIVENVLGLQVFVNDAFGVKIAHSLHQKANVTVQTEMWAQERLTVETSCFNTGGFK